MTGFLKESKGFTLIELIVAMGIAVIVLGGVYTAYHSQQRSFMVQQDLVRMQQGLRSAAYYMEREIRMAGCDPTGDAGNAGIIAANATTIHFREDTRGNTEGSEPDGACDDPNEDIWYRLTDADGDGDNDLVRDTGGGNQIVAEDIDSLNFVYRDRNGNVTGVLANIRSVEITIVATTNRFNRFHQRNLTTRIDCRNIGI